ncbi:MAG: hypothetical protein FJ304_19920 [Planctomycetes bacterium]|nr:hypothetical protein [Planctomycetota bacterium]
MDPTPAEPPPGCLVLLIRLSAGMTAEVVTGRGESVAFAAARQLSDELIEGLVTTHAGGYAVGALDVAVLGYRTGDDGAPQLLSLLPDGNPTTRFVPLAQLAELPAESRAGEGLPRKWTVLPPRAGDPCAADALARVYQMVAVWLTGRYSGRPPVVIHCTNPDGLDDAYQRVARSLTLLATGYGPVRLLEYVFAGQESAEPNPPTPFPKREGEEEADDPLTPPSLLGKGVGGLGSCFLNDWDITQQWDALFTHTWREDAPDWAQGTGAFARPRAMWAQKMGNTPEQWEDAYATAEGGGAAAVADGASTGIYCNIWARQLSERFLTDRPDTRDPGSLNKWVNGLRTEWRTAINYSTLNWSKQAKVDQVGAAATLLGLEFGPATESGARPWRACAVGDASLFWIRAGKLLATFPVVADNQFGSAPLLVRSNPGFKTLAVAAEGTCEPGDRFLLATDAVAARLFKSAATGPGPEWCRFETIAEDDWRAELDVLRRANDMVNDDCTLVVLNVGEDDGRAGGVSPPFEEAIPVAEAVALERGSDAPRSPDDNEQGADAPRSPAAEEAEAIAADAGDLMIDLPRETEQEQGADAPRSPDDEQGARDGSPETTDPEV